MEIFLVGDATVSYYFCGAVRRLAWYRSDVVASVSCLWVGRDERTRGARSAARSSAEWRRRVSARRTQARRARGHLAAGGGTARTDTGRAKAGGCRCRGAHLQPHNAL